MTRTVVLTGATGFLGSHLARALVQNCFTVHAYRRGTSDLRRITDLAPQIHWHQLPNDLEAAFRANPKPEAVIHCAALYGRNAESAAEMIRANTLLPVELFELAVKYSVPRFINTGTALPPDLDRYALSKHHAAVWLKQLAGPTHVLNLNVQHMYGPDANRSNFITAIFRQCLAHTPSIDLTDGKQHRDFIFVEDVATAFVHLLKAPKIPSGEKSGFTSIDVGSGDAIEVRGLVETIARLTNSRSRLNFGAVAYRPGEPMLTQANIAPLKGLDWRPQVTLEDGLKRTLAAMQTG